MLKEGTMLRNHHKHMTHAMLDFMFNIKQWTEKLLLLEITEIQSLIKITLL